MVKSLFLKFPFLVVVCVFITGCQTKDDHLIIQIQNENLRTSIEYGLDTFEKNLNKEDVTLGYASKEDKANFIIKLKENKNSLQNDGYSLLNNNGVWTLSAEKERGLIYGLLDVSKQFDNSNKLSELTERNINSHYPFRAIKFNLPWFSYRSGENLSLHYETCRDLKFWESFLDMMVENKFNALTLWNLHPYIYMVTPINFPKASPFTDHEMAEWQQFFKSLFKMAKARGIDTYVVNWNIFVSEEFSKAYGIADYSSAAGFWGQGETNELVEQYTKEIVTQTINEYEDLTGIGITLGERMGGMTSEERKAWVDRTIIEGLKDADREARLIYRAPLSAGTSSHGTVSVSTEELTRNAIENIELEEDVLIEFKFNWSHAHSAPKVSIVHGGILTDTYWEPEPKNYKGVWTMRNEDFFALRWAQPDFIRSFIDYNSQAYIGGCIIGSETYIPAKDYITKKEFITWDYAFQRQWLFYKVWGNLLYDKDTKDNYFAEAISKKFQTEKGDDILKAWKLASMNANRMASFYQGTWDATLYTEGFTTVGGKFIDIDNFINRPILDSSYINISAFVKGYILENQTSPLELAKTTENESNEALRIIDQIESETINSELKIELNDIRAWSHFGLYFASKIRGGVALEQYRTHGNTKKQDEAIEHLNEALKHWKAYTLAMEKYNVPVMPYQFDSEFSWRKHIKDAERDIEIASQ